MERSYEKYFRQNRLPHLWCPGCGNGIAMKAIVEAIEKKGLSQDNTVIVSGIGCSSRASGYMDSDTLHTAHGRAIPFATGIKLANPELNVVVITGDGDCTAIGGNHFIHGCRRNVDLTVVLFNNNIYGMTGGQAYPMPPLGKKATTAYSASAMNEHSVWMISSPARSIFSWRRRMDCSVIAGLPTGKPVSSWMRPVTWMW